MTMELKLNNPHKYIGEHFEIEYKTIANQSRKFNDNYQEKQWFETEK